MKLQTYDDELLRLAEDLAQRLLPAFDTPTGFLVSSCSWNICKAKQSQLSLCPKSSYSTQLRSLPW